MRIPWNPQLMAPMRFPWCSPQVRWNSFPQRRAGGSFHGTFLGTLERLDLEKYGKMDENGLVSPDGDFEDSDLRSIWRFEFGKVVIFWNMSSWTENRELRIGISAANYRGFRKPWVISRRNVRCDMNIPMTNWGPRWAALESIVSAIYLI